MVEQRATGEEAVFIAFDFVTAAIDNQRRAFFDAGADVVLDPVAGFTRDDRTHLGVEFHAVLDFQRAGALGQFRDDLVGHVADQHRYRDRHAALAGRAISRADQTVDGLLDVGIGHHDHMVLGPAQRLDAFAVAGAGFVDVLGNRGRADKAQSLHVRMVEQTVDGQLVALQHGENALGQTGLREQIGDEQADRRIALARLQDEGIASGNRHRHHPHRHHEGEVERRDAGDDAQRLAQCPVVHAGRHLVSEVALEQLRRTAGELDDVDAACDLALRIGENLAMFGGDHRGDAVLVQVEQLKELEHHPGAAQWRRIAPGRKCGLGAGYCGIDILDAGQLHLACHRAGGRVVDRLAAA